MSRPASKAVQMACLTIDYRDYLMPAAAATKVMDLLSQAFECTESYEGTSRTYTPTDKQPAVSVAIVRPNQVRAPRSQEEGTALRLTDNRSPRLPL